MYSESEEMQGLIDRGGGDHEAREKCAANDPTERVPRLRIKPIPEFESAIASEEEGGAVIEVGIEFVNHGFVAEY